MTDSNFRQQYVSRLVGRERELHILRRLLLTVEQQGSGMHSAEQPTTLIVPRAIFLTGELGIGKTRLAREISQEAEQSGWAVIHVRCYKAERSMKNHIWVAALDQAITQNLWHPREMNHSQYHLAPMLGLLLPHLADLFPEGSMTAEESAGHTGHTTHTSFDLWESIRAVLAAISEKIRLLIVLDDVHWADDDSCKCLEHLLCHLNDSPLLIIGTCCEQGITALGSIIAQPRYEHAVELLRLHPLTPEQIETLVSDLPHAALLSPSKLQQIQVDAAGNPFFAEELAWSPLYALSQVMTATLDSLLGKLSDACRQLLSYAVVLNDPFDLHAMYALLPKEATANEDMFFDALDEARQSGILIEKGSGNAISYHFRYPLLVRHLYQKVSAARRMRLSRDAVRDYQ